MKIIELIPEDNEVQASIKGFMVEDAALLSIKVAGAEAGDLYDLRMEGATLIRKAARDLAGHCYTLEIFGFKDTQYLYLIKEAIEEYRVLFVEWVKSFDEWNYIIDRWGLFNPPGIDPNEADDDSSLD